MLVKKIKQFDYYGQAVNYYNKIKEDPKFREMTLSKHEEDGKTYLDFTMEYPDK